VDLGRSSRYVVATGRPTAPAGLVVFYGWNSRTSCQTNELLSRGPAADSSPRLLAKLSKTETPGCPRTHVHSRSSAARANREGGWRNGRSVTFRTARQGSGRGCVRGSAVKSWDGNSSRLPQIVTTAWGHHTDERDIPLLSSLLPPCFPAKDQSVP